MGRVSDSVWHIEDKHDVSVSKNYHEYSWRPIEILNRFTSGSMYRRHCLPVCSILFHFSPEGSRIHDDTDFQSLPFYFFTLPMGFSI